MLTYGLVGGCAATSTLGGGRTGPVDPRTAALVAHVPDGTFAITGVDLAELRRHRASAAMLRLADAMLTEELRAFVDSTERLAILHIPPVAREPLDEDSPEFHQAMYERIYGMQRRRYGDSSNPSTGFEVFLFWFDRTPTWSAADRVMVVESTACGDEAIEDEELAVRRIDASHCVFGPRTVVERFEAFGADAPVVRSFLRASSGAPIVFSYRPTDRFDPTRGLARMPELAESSQWRSIADQFDRQIELESVEVATRFEHVQSLDLRVRFESEAAVAVAIDVRMQDASTAMRWIGPLDEAEAVAQRSREAMRRDGDVPEESERFDEEDPPAFDLPTLVRWFSRRRTDQRGAEIHLEYASTSIAAASRIDRLESMIETAEYDEDDYDEDEYDEEDYGADGDGLTEDEYMVLEDTDPDPREVIALYERRRDSFDLTDDVSTLALVVNAYIDRGDFETADAIVRPIWLDTNAPERARIAAAPLVATIAWYRNDRASLEAAYEFSREENHPSTVEPALWASVLMFEGKLTEARAVLETALPDTHPKLVALFERARINLELLAGRTDAAETEARAAARWSELLAQGWGREGRTCDFAFDLVSVLTALGRDEAAREQQLAICAELVENGFLEPEMDSIATACTLHSLTAPEEESTRTECEAFLSEAESRYHPTHPYVLQARVALTRIAATQDAQRAALRTALGRLPAGSPHRRIWEWTLDGRRAARRR